MLEGMSALHVFSNSRSSAVQFVFVGKQSFQSNRPASGRRRTVKKRKEA